MCGPSGIGFYGRIYLYVKCKPEAEFAEESLFRGCNSVLLQIFVTDNNDF